MNIKTIFTSSFFLKRVFLGALLILIFISGITYRHSIALSESTDSVLHSYQVNLELEQVMSHMKDAETGRRGYIITNNPVFLEPFTNSRKKVYVEFETLRILTDKNLKQKNNLDTLNTLINKRFTHFETTQININKYGAKQDLLNKSLLEGKVIMDKIRTKIDEMIGLEMIYLKERQLKYEDEISFTPIFTLALFLFTVLIFVISYMMINRDLQNVTKANEELMIMNESINQTQEVGNIGTWQWNLADNSFIYSDNLFRILGSNPHSFRSNAENFIDFVHPDDKHILIEGLDRVVKENQTSFHFFRVIRRDGALRYFTSNSKILEDKNGKKVVVGVTTDVTELHLGNLELEDRNQELEQSNKELASFNYVASHDLQEPLRKIQLFISRIEYSEKQRLSEVGVEYFSRINQSALRMRTLIDDLLMFSRTNKADKIFERTDLTNIFQKAISELAEAIEEKNAVIESMRLPILQVIPYQIQQLFINLISNSLKYSRAEVEPSIKIECEKVRAKDYEIITKANGEKKYFKFTFTDNGLGFEQSQAENIFILFNRLHHKTEYSGTGIGLAICKKIVENHGGFIMAKGVLGEGATFVFFLPE
jgi:signal transduction histidine kinase